MSGMIERLPNWPSALPDLFGWVEAGLPGLHTVPGLHGIRIEESFTEGTYILRAELPGIDPAKDVEITVTEGVLTLRAERSTEATDKRHTEFRYGTFARAVRLPADARGDDATADYKDGVLTITVPVPETKTGTKTIPVRHTGA
ncbi:MULTISPECIES: Hsp20/alpha crystallin family protein [unclassified Streptomyces]|uniref:Hsp20/alpha crystallin family protein n=1 Tax=Streptomyces sp. SYP-A7185 TaxID=3040076 RepID=UPI0038F77163